jgi:hypothetical protein
LVGRTISPPANLEVRLTHHILADAREPDNETDPSYGAILQMQMTRHILILALLIAAGAWLVRPTIKPGPFTYDESDYMYAARFSPLAHWMDLGGMPFGEFVQIGLTRGRNPRDSQALSEMARAADDPNVYRHYHGPVLWYWLCFLRQFTVVEFVLRCGSLVFPLLTLLMIYFGSLRVLPAESRQIGALLASVLFALSPITLEATDLAPHPVFVLFYITALLLAAKVMTGGARRDWYAAVIAAGAAFCSLEVAFVLIAALAVCAWRRRAELRVDGRFILTSTATFVATVLALWPAGLVKLDFAKAYLFMAYLALFRHDAWGADSQASIWANRLALSPVEWVLIVSGLVVFVFRRKTAEGIASEVFVWFGLLMFVVMLRVNGYGSRYISPYSAALDVTAGWMIAGALTQLAAIARYALLVVLVIGLAASAARVLERVRPADDPGFRDTIASLHAAGLDHASLLVPQLALPAFHYYLPEAQVHGYLDAPSPEIAARVHATAIVVQKGDAVEIQRVTPPTP